MDREPSPPPLSQKRLSQAPPLTQNRTFHPGFDKDPHPVVFSVEDSCFKVDAARLASHSDFIKNMLYDEKRRIGKPKEGTEDFPIEIEGLKSSTFVNFLRWFDHHSWSPLAADHLEQLLDVLHVAHMWGIPSAVEFARNQIKAQFTLSPAHELYLARRYNLKEWVEGAVRALLLKPLKDHTHDDREHLGFQVYSVIAAAKEAITAERARLVVMPPYPKAGTYDDANFCPKAEHARCKRVWGDVWFSSVMPRINRQVDPLPLNLVPDVLEAANHHGMNKDCKIYLMTWFRNSCDHFNREEDMTVATVNFVRALM